jgi:alpha-ketoglutarate-dependent 2,4-dichlorophenoxyacetate dioxygenase
MSTTTTETVTAPAPTPSLRVIKNGFGAEITGLDFANGVTDEGYMFIEDAVKKVGSPAGSINTSMY